MHFYHVLCVLSVRQSAYTVRHTAGSVQQSTIPIQSVHTYIASNLSKNMEFRLFDGELFPCPPQKKYFLGNGDLHPPYPFPFHTPMGIDKIKKIL